MMSVGQFHCPKLYSRERVEFVEWMHWRRIRHRGFRVCASVCFTAWCRSSGNLLRCPGTLFISHENANFLFSVFRVVQGEAKTPKIMGCCRANFAFLHALKIGTFRGKWTLEWVIKTPHFVLLALYFLITIKLAFSLIASQQCLARSAKNVWVRAQNRAKVTFCLYDWKPI